MSPCIRSVLLAVVLLHGTGGTGKEYLQPDIADHLFKPGQILDASRYYVVLPDGIGAGGSSKPSDGLHGKFPRYGYNDQVSTQQITLARLGVDHLKLVSGISMGGMQTWLWAERFPEAMDAAVPRDENYVCGAMRNYTGYCNPELDKMVDEQSAMSDVAKRKQMVWAIEKKLTDDDARPILFYPRAANCYYPKVKGLVTQVNSIYNGQRFEDLWLDN